MLVICNLSYLMGCAGRQKSCCVQMPVPALWVLLGFSQRSWTRVCWNCSSSSFCSQMYNWRATNVSDLLDTTFVLVSGLFFSNTDCDSGMCSLYKLRLKTIPAASMWHKALLQDLGRKLPGFPITEWQSSRQEGDTRLFLLLIFL